MTRNPIPLMAGQTTVQFKPPSRDLNPNPLQLDTLDPYESATVMYTRALGITNPPPRAASLEVERNSNSELALLMIH